MDGFRGRFEFDGLGDDLRCDSGRLTIGKGWLTGAKTSKGSSSPPASSLAPLIWMLPLKTLNFRVPRMIKLYSSKKKSQGLASDDMM